MRMLHLSEVADRLNFSTAKTKALFENGLLPGVNAGTRRRALWLIADEVLDAWMRGEAPKPQPQPPKKITRRGRIDAHVPKVF
jgi:hypothetical protein